MLVFLLLAAAQEDSAARVKALVDALGEDDTAVREAADKELLGLGSKAREALETHSNHPDAEVRARVVALSIRLFFPALKTYTLKARSARVLEYDLRGRADTSRPGRYHLRLTFTSTKDYVEDPEERKKVFQATLTSDGSDFHVR